LIGSNTRLLGIIGWPVSHSRSPAMHNAAIAALGLDYVYLPLAVAPDQVGGAVRGLSALGFAGANVTVPHKVTVMRFLDGTSPVARAAGAANTLVVHADGTVWGDNTDGAGFLADLRAHGVEVTGRQILLLGAGGAARSVAHALADAGAGIAIANRTLVKAQELCHSVRTLHEGARAAAYRYPEDLPGLAERADLIVNATSLGSHGQPGLPWPASVTFRPGQAVYDLVYTPAGKDPEPNGFLRLAASQGASTMDGLGMLLHQGARAFEIWTGQPAPIDVMRQALLGSGQGANGA
jgi:shikimate dehydrogenase